MPGPSPAPTPAPTVAAPLVHGARSALPVVLSVPHAGRAYPDWLVERSRAGTGLLERLEDPLVDRLAWRALGLGVGAVVARMPRAGIDCNRAMADLDPAALGEPGIAASPRARAGLGLVPTRLGPLGALWRRPLARVELDALVAGAWAPYHDALAAALDRAAGPGGPVLLVDCHSMPPRPRGGAQIVIGDRHGASADRWIAEAAMAVCRAAGFSVAYNDPFAGGHIVERHGAPARGRHAIQVEIARDTYLGRDGRTPGAGFERVAALLGQLVERLGAAIAADGSLAEAAE